jgi:hypothetical protein
MNTKEQLEKSLNKCKNIIKITEYIWFLSFIGIFVSVIVLCWHSWDLAWRIGVTSLTMLIFLMIIRYLYLEALKDIKLYLLKYKEDENPTTIKKRGGFMGRLQDAMEKQEKLKNK